MITKEPKKILIAEDSASFRSKLGGLMAEAGHSVEYVPEGASIVEWVRKAEAKFDALILDLDMTLFDAFVLLEWLRESSIITRLMVLCVTGKDGSNDDLPAYLSSLGARGLLSKNVSNADLVARINKYLYEDVTVTRRAQRVYRTLPAKFMLGAAEHGGEILNISTVGVFLHTRLVLRPDSIMRIKFAVDEGSSELAPSGIVKWVTGVNDRSNRFIGAGVEFKSLSPVELKAIDGYVAHHLGGKGRT